MSSKNSKLPGVIGRPDNLLWIDPQEVDIVPGENPRDEDLDIEELAQLIDALGFLMDGAISVYRGDDNRLKLQDGQRRLLAVRDLIARGRVIPRIPAILVPRMADPVQRLIAALAVNRGKPLSPMSEARAFARLVNFGWTVERIAHEAVGRSPVYVQGRLALLDATPIVVEALQAGDIGVKAVGEIVRNAERNGTAQAVELATHKARKARRMTPRQARSVDEAVIQALAKLEERYGRDEVCRVLTTTYLM